MWPQMSDVDALPGVLVITSRLIPSGDFRMTLNVERHGMDEISFR